MSYGAQLIAAVSQIIAYHCGISYDATTYWVQPSPSTLIIRVSWIVCIQASLI